VTTLRASTALRLPHPHQEAYVSTAEVTPRRSSAPARYWRNFRRWRRGRPFWGGLLLIVAGLELFYSANLDLGAIEIQFVPQGFLVYVIPGLMLLCGFLTWISPGQRLFYGILGALVGVFSLIGLNLGGFLLGTILGMVGGALTAAWTPVAPPPPPAVAGDDEPVGDDDDEPAQPSWTERDDNTNTSVDALLSGPLSDTLPEEQRNPLHKGPVRHAGAGWADDQTPRRPDDDLPRRRGAALLVLVIAMAFGVAVLRAPAPASAEPCPPSATPSGKPTTARPTATATRPTTPPAAPPASSRAPAASPSASSAPAQPAARGNPLDGVIDWFRNLFKPRTPPPSPSPSPSPSASSTPAPAPRAAGTTPPAPRSTPTASASPSKKPSPSVCPSASGPAVRAADQPATGAPAVADAPSILTASRLDQFDITYDGVFVLKTKAGRDVRVLKFSMARAVNTNFALRVPAGPRTMLITSSELVVSNEVRPGQKPLNQRVEFYTSEFRGTLVILGIPIPIPLTFTPDSPPPLTLTNMTFIDVRIQLVLVQSNLLTGRNLRISYLAPTAAGSTNR